MGPEDQLKLLEDLFAEANRGFVSRRRRRELAEQFRLAVEPVKRFATGSDQSLESLAAWVPMAQSVSEDHRAQYYQQHTASSGDAVELYGYVGRVWSEYRALVAHRTLSGGQVACILGEIHGYGAMKNALLATSVLTSFEDSHRAWASAPFEQLESFLNRANERWFAHGPGGSFMAIQAGLLDPGGGRLYISQAGNDLLQLWRAASRSIEVMRLKGAPAVDGLSTELPSSVPESPYRCTTVDLAPGDIVLCMTDGLESATRDCTRHVSQQEAQSLSGTERPGWRDQASPHVWHDPMSRTVGEDLGTDRVHDVIQAALSEMVYQLERFRDPVPPEFMRFDFRSLPATPRTASLAAAACELVFRLRPVEEAADDECIDIDIELDGFLKETFSGYGHFFSTPAPVDEESDPRYRRYLGVGADPACGDCAILAIGINPDAELRPASQSLETRISSLDGVSLDDIEPLTDDTEHPHTSEDEVLEELPVVEDELEADGSEHRSPPRQNPNGYDEDLEELPSVDE